MFGLAAALALVLAAIWITPSLRGHLEHAAERLTEGLSPTYGSNRVRIGVARGSARLVRDHPLGVGTGNFREAFVPYRDPVEHRISGWRSPVTHPHNQYLATAAETGWLGGILLLGALGLLAWLLLRGLPAAPTALAGAVRATAGVTVVGIGFESLVATPFLNPAALFNLTVIGGFGAAAVAGGDNRPVRLPVRIGLLVLTAALLAYCTVPAYRSYLARLRARSSLEARHVNVAALQRAWRDAAEAMPRSAEIWQRVGSWQARLGQREKAIASYDRAIGLRPNFVACLLAKGDLLAQKRSYEAALEPVARAADLQPWNPDPEYLTGKIFTAAGYPDQAEAAFRRAIEADRSAYRGPAESYRPTAVATRALAELTARLMEKVERIERNQGRTATRSLLLEVLALDPRHAEANLKLAVLLRQEGKREEAARHRYTGKLETGLNLIRDALRNRAETPSRIVDRKFGEAIHHLQLASFEDRGNPDPYYYIAVVHALRDKEGVPWHDRAQARASLDEARKRGLYRLEDAPDGGRYREVVRGFWEGE
jgi:tetratricopeptide (TPR) repeat protein